MLAFRQLWAGAGVGMGGAGFFRVGRGEGEGEGDGGGGGGGDAFGVLGVLGVFAGLAGVTFGSFFVVSFLVVVVCAIVLSVFFVRPVLRARLGVGRDSEGEGGGKGVGTSSIGAESMEGEESVSSGRHWEEEVV